jgi:pimeloyl-ACP methyl ester carboxylesterase
MTSFGALSADDSGREGGQPAIVLLPGLTFERAVWAPIIEALRAHDPQRRVIALDLPGHGGSAACPPHDVEHVVEVVHGALRAAGADQGPVMVGHSMSGALASIYAARYPTTAVVNVDQPPLIGDFARLVRQLESPLRGPNFEQVWRNVFAASFHTELLPAPARDLVERFSHPDQDLVLSYWQMLFQQPVEALETMVDATIREVGARGIPYLLVLGSPLPANTREHLTHRIPRLEVVEWAGTGHFPHLARPAEFARLCSEVAEIAAPLPSAGA